MPTIAGTVLNKAKGDFTPAASDALVTMGRGLVHAIAPDDYEYYMCTLELLRSSGETAAFMNLPVMPSNITESRTSLTTITKTNNVVVSMINPSFNPVDISLRGTFGRKLRISFGQQQFKDQAEEGASIPFFNIGMFTGAAGVGDNRTMIAKTGYGLTKMMQKILTAATKLDPNGKPYRLVFTNHAFNTAYYVEVVQDNYSMDENNNMIWNYSIELRAVAAYTTIKSVNDFLGQVTNQSLSRSVTRVLGQVSDLLTCGVMNMF